MSNSMRHPPPAPGLGALLRDLREQSGLTVPAIQAAVGVSRATIYHWEGPESRPDPRELASLARLYNLDAATELRLYRLRAGVVAEQAEAVPA